MANALLLGLYQRGAPWKIDQIWLRYFPVEAFSNKPVLPFLLAALGLLLIDLSYLLGLCRLLRYRKAIRNGTVPNRHRKVGWLSAIGSVVLIPVLINSVQLLSGTNYRPYDLVGSGFVTLADIEGPDLRLSHDAFYNMDYIAHEGTLLDAESWYFQQYAAFGVDDSPNDVPRLEVTITRYPWNALAEMRMAELNRQKFDNSGDDQRFDVLDECLYAKWEGWTHTSEMTGETRAFLPGRYPCAAAGEYRPVCKLLWRTGPDRVYGTVCADVSRTVRPPGYLGYFGFTAAQRPIGPHWVLWGAVR